MEWILGTIFLMLLKVHYLPGLSDIIVFAPITIYVGMFLFGVGFVMYLQVRKWIIQLKYGKEWELYLWENN